MSEAVLDPVTEIPSYRVLGVRVNGVQIPDAIQILESWIHARGRARYVAVTGMHGVSEAREKELY